MHLLRLSRVFDPRGGGGWQERAPGFLGERETRRGGGGIKTCFAIWFSIDCVVFWEKISSEEIEVESFSCQRGGGKDGNQKLLAERGK